MFLGIGYQNWLLVGMTLIVAVSILIRGIYYYRYFEKRSPAEVCGGCIGVVFGFFVGTGTMVCWIVFGELQKYPESFWPVYMWWIICALGMGGINLLMARYQWKKITEDHPNKANDSLKKLAKQIKEHRPKTK